MGTRECCCSWTVLKGKSNLRACKLSQLIDCLSFFFSSNKTVYHVLCAGTFPQYCNYKVACLIWFSYVAIKHEKETKIGAVLNIIIITITVVFTFALLFTPEGVLKALPKSLLLVTGLLNSFLKPSQLPVEYMSSATNIHLCSAISYSITRTISALLKKMKPVMKLIFLIACWNWMSA